MKKGFYFTIFVVLLSIILPMTVFAHSGKTDANGCHTNKKTGEYHCHVESITLVKEARTEARMLARTQAKNENTILAEEPSYDTCLIKGNISSSGEKIYHVPGCSSYNVTKIDEARGERWFCTEQEALDTGWRKALNCP